MLWSYISHLRACRQKQHEREQRLADLDQRYYEPFTADDKHILSLPISAIVVGVNSAKLFTRDVLFAYGKAARLAHLQTNCLTEVMLSSAEGWADAVAQQPSSTARPLAGVPVSLKDMIALQGWDACIGYSAHVGKPFKAHSAIVRLLLDAGAVPFVKTNVPTTLLSFESSNDVFGTTENPHKKGFSPGGSSGGEGALLALGGSRIGVGTDVAGSVRAPAHYSGVYTIRSSMYRFPRTGNATCMPGQEAIPATHSPMARTLEDLETFWRAVMEMRPWEYDHSVIEMPWRDVKLPTDRPLRWGVMWDDGIVAPSPACSRALKMVTDALKGAGHEIVTLQSPSPYEGLQLASQILLAEGGKTAGGPLRTGERNSAGIATGFIALGLPQWARRIFAWYIRYIRRDPIYAGLIEGWREKTVQEYYALIAKREEYRAQWFKVWRGMDISKASGEGVDFILTVPNALPAVPHGGLRHGWKACCYTFLFSLLDYPCGVMPITKVEGVLDSLPEGFRPRNLIEKKNYKMYNSEGMDGLPVGVQVIGQRLNEEHVMEAMKLIEELMRREGRKYAGLALF
ncbi:amidase signature enzyme [Coniophora puteana RWD-64-598 SS2]|uniref:amidase n=1 Tax=Coniophora puteana (strain RWD-64-598) TaxID=741705 RepID=A0A5M3ME29_CONPW|nr:amidase signature enzyme [Coniophora puteana RWD-64-598 SS2]EIW77307.1 amidase signature enzyme [Coniophora puteana RWD-64-598 SS2]